MYHWKICAFVAECLLKIFCWSNFLWRKFVEVDFHFVLSRFWMSDEKNKLSICISILSYDSECSEHGESQPGTLLSLLIVNSNCSQRLFLNHLNGIQPFLNELYWKAHYLAAICWQLEKSFYFPNIAVSQWKVSSF